MRSGGVEFLPLAKAPPTEGEGGGEKKRPVEVFSMLGKKSSGKGKKCC
jgi:hypothetical protein